MNLYLLAGKFCSTLRRSGVRGTALRMYRHVRHAAQHRESDAFDLKNGTDTSGIEPLWKLTIRSDSARWGERYQPSREEEVVDAVRDLGIATGGFTFIDLGCGKGRTLLVAARLGFQTVVGVEFAAELVEIARINLEKAGIVNATVFEQDAGQFQFPTSNFVLYLYNPFSAEILRQVLSNLAKVADGEFDFYIVYKVPDCAHLLNAAPFLKAIGPVAGRPHMRVWRKG
jgi:SAM-dependent methyltransferase